MNVNIQSLLHTIEQSANDGVENANIMLWEMIIMPIQKNGMVQLADIDYSAFTLEEFSEFINYLEYGCYGDFDHSSLMYAILKKCEPAINNTISYI